MIISHKYEVFVDKKPMDYLGSDYIIFDEKSEFNDFGYYTRYNCKIIQSGIERHNTNILVGVITSEKDINGLGNVMEGTNSLHLSHPDLSYKFFTLLTDKAAYRALIKQFGVGGANDILFAMNDLIFITQYVDSLQKVKNWTLQNAVNSNVFKKSFMRKSETFFSYKTSTDILQGLAFEELNRISTSLYIEFNLKGFTSPHTLELEYNNSSIIPKRINILIGKNGLGKSQTLSNFVKFANLSLNRKQKGQEFKFYDPSISDRRPMINRILAFVMPGDGGDSYPREKLIRNISYKKIILTKNHTDKKLTLGQDLILLSRNEDDIANVSRWNLFIDALNKVLPVESIYIDVKNFDKVSLISLGGKKINEDKRLDIWSEVSDSIEPYFILDGHKCEMSSGQFAFFKFALKSCQYIENGTYVLIDEPETHMHPEFISEFVSLLDDILEKTGSLALVATHSPYLVREVSREQVNVYRVNRKNKFEIVKPRLKTFGSNVSDISDFVFEDELKNRLSEKILRQAKNDGLSYMQVKELCEDELPVEMLHYLKQELKGDKDEKITSA